jgi:enoyl-[acyl-carrier protein] reductase I
VLSVDFSVAWRPGGNRHELSRLEGKTFLVFGVANKRSVAWAVGKSLEEQGARVVYSVRSEERRKSLEALLAGRPVFVCDVEEEGAVERLAAEVAAAGHAPLQGIVHSIAFANYAGGLQPFHATKRADFLQAAAVSAFSLSRSPAPSSPTWRPTPRS